MHTDTGNLKCASTKRIEKQWKNMGVSHRQEEEKYTFIKERELGKKMH